MDPNACFAAYCGCVDDGEMDLAYDAADNYRAWVLQGGFPATDAWGDSVVVLDPEQDRYGVGPQPVATLGVAVLPVHVEKFRRATRDNVDADQPATDAGETDYDPRGPR